jgi:hypothetical protein
VKWYFPEQLYNKGMNMDGEIGNLPNSCITGANRRIAVDSEIGNFLNSCITGELTVDSEVGNFLNS